MQEKTVQALIILGKDERLKFEADRDTFSQEVQRIYDETQTYHDGKWLMFEPMDTTLFDDFTRLLRIKRKPNRKQFIVVISSANEIVFLQKIM